MDAILGIRLSRNKYLSHCSSVSNLIKPCTCDGSQRYVHRYCLDKWRQLGVSMSCMTTCPTCKFVYKIKHIPDQSSLTWRLLSAIFFRLVWIVLMFLFISVTISPIIGNFMLCRLNLGDGAWLCRNYIPTSIDRMLWHLYGQEFAVHLPYLEYIRCVWDSIYGQQVLIELWVPLII